MKTLLGLLTCSITVTWIGLVQADDTRPHFERVRDFASPPPKPAKSNSLKSASEHFQILKSDPSGSPAAAAETVRVEIEAIRAEAGKNRGGEEARLEQIERRLSDLERRLSAIEASFERAQP